VLNSAKESSARTALLAASLDMVLATLALALAQSAVLVADCLKTGLELAAVLLAWLAIRRITRGDAARYEYGLGKLETLSSFVIAALMGLVFLVIVGNAIRNLISPSHVSGVGVYISLVAQVVLAVFNAVIFVRSRKAAKSENSPIMESQSKLFMTRLVGNVFIFLCGCLWLQHVLHTNLEKTLEYGLYPFVPGEILKLYLAAALLPGAWALVRRVRK